MRTLILLGVAASAVMIADRADAQEPATRAAIAAAAAREAVGDAGAKPTERTLDYGVSYSADEQALANGADRFPVESAVRAPNPAAPAGRWICTYDSPNAREYRCTLDGDAPAAAMAAAASPHGMATQQWADTAWEEEEEGYRRELERACRPDNGIGGSVLGGVLGGLAGNRIAGRGNRTLGTLLGGALGAVAGRVIDQADNKKQCRDMVRRIEERQRSWNGANAYAGGYGQGWYTPGYVVTTVITPAATETIETVTTTTHYETVAVPRQRYAAKKRVYKPRPKPRCGC
jgi:hypothetical protein